MRRGGWRDIHLAVTYENVAVAAEAPEALVLVNVGVVGVQEAAVTQYEIENGITVAVWVRRIASEHVVNLTPVMFAARDLRIAVVIRVAQRAIIVRDGAGVEDRVTISGAPAAREAPARRGPG